MNFENEILLARLRKRPSRLWLAHFVLAIVIAVLCWVSVHQLAAWMVTTIEVLSIFALFFLWLVPTWRFASNSIDITNQRIMVRGGLFGRVQRDVQVSAVTGIDFSRGSGITIAIDSADPIVLSGMSRPKVLAEALRKTLAK